MNTTISPITMAIEVAILPVSDTDRALSFYRSLGWRIDADISGAAGFRLVQFTPPGSACSIHFGSEVTLASPGSELGLYLVVNNIEEARSELMTRGVKVSEVFHQSPGGQAAQGHDPQRRSYASFVTFSDPDGNRWLVQEITARLPGRLEREATFATQNALSSALRRAAAAHGLHEKQICQSDVNWPDWYANYILSEQVKDPPAS